MDSESLEERVLSLEERVKELEELTTNMGIYMIVGIVITFGLLIHFIVKTTL